MANNRLIVQQPVLPPVPTSTEDLVRWARAITLELDRYFAGLSDQAVDHRLFGRVDTQIVGAGFTILPTLPFIDLYAAGPVTSDVTTAIKPGSDGQLICLENRSTFSITIKDGAGTFLSGDKVLTQHMTLLIRWDGALWVVI